MRRLFFSLFKKSVKFILALKKCYSAQLTIRKSQSMIELNFNEKISEYMIGNLFKKLRQICSVSLDKSNLKLDGPGKIIEIDESLYAKKRFDEKTVVGVWSSTDKRFNVKEERFHIQTAGHHITKLAVKKNISIRIDNNNGNNDRVLWYTLVLNQIAKFYCPGEDIQKIEDLYRVNCVSDDEIDGDLETAEDADDD
ncbi:unnamed protein product [Brachionus calyciflorus]|uniref:Uncharacterized protein n=1 Tax=Brachionus calyciflorus TaxID=104777 RepID=A0A814ETC1_9BILA|nr:unnamed protein product [Brachionus calyciflorus]